MNDQYIVDTSILVQLLITEAHTSETKSLFASVANGNKIIIPEFSLLECTNVLWKHIRFHGLSQADAKKQIQILIALDVVIIPTLGLLPRALEIGLNHQLAIYDSVYIALAQQMKYPLITDDTRQANAAQAEGVTLKVITDLTP